MVASNSASQSLVCGAEALLGELGSVLVEATGFDTAGTQRHTSEKNNIQQLP